jgi:hypothetical protein
VANCEHPCEFCATVTGGNCAKAYAATRCGTFKLHDEYGEVVREYRHTADKPSFEEVGRSIGALVAEKNAAYGDAVNATAEYLRWLFPDGIPVDRYRDVGLLVRIGDKLKRIANGDRGEESAYGDIAGYGILGARR